VGHESIGAINNITKEGVMNGWNSRWGWHVRHGKGQSLSETMKRFSPRKEIMSMYATAKVRV
jgi:hypothetical protein